MTKKTRTETPDADLIDTLERAPNVGYKVVDGKLVEVPAPPARPPTVPVAR